MTETDKLADAQVFAIKFWKDNGHHVLQFDKLVEMLAAYGAAQYEAGAASMRERASEKIVTCGDRKCGCPSHEAQWELLDAVRALPLREKD